MAVMEAEVSRVLAAFITDMGLGQDAARALASEYATAAVGDLPGWLTENRTDPVQAALFPIDAKYNPGQSRDPGGEDGGRWTKGPSLPDLDMDGFDLISQADGSFGELALGADEAGDVRVAFHEGREARALDLAADDVDEMSGALSRLAGARDDLDGDVPAGEVVDDEWFGAGRENKVELYGNGVISVVFGAEDDDPYTLNLDPADEDQDDVQAILDALAEVEQELDARQPVQAKYNPSQPRDPGGDDGGRWVSGPAGKAAGALKDALKLAGKIDLDDNETLVGSAKIDGDGGIRMALTDQGGKRMLRLGLGGEMYGKANREEGIPAWDANPPREPLSKAESDRLDAEHDALDDEYDSATPARQEEITTRQEDIHELLTAGDMDFNGTAKIDEYSMRRLIDKLRPALDEAVEQEKAENKAWDEIEALEAKGNPDPDRMAELRRIVDRTDYIVFDEGIIPGSEWGDVHYEVYLDDVSQGPLIHLGVTPKGATDDWGDGRDWQGQFDPAETRKFLRLLDQFSKAPVQAAAGVDTHPGGEELKHWWVYGAGSTRWSTFTELYDQLRKEITDMSDDHVKAIAASWYHLRYGIWPGSDANRVKHGKPPRGHAVGPG